ncbi:hypothetical protein OAA16_00955 [Candidatus Pelagibacter sp.]|nr:hypothetical protein [Candidatus Pelagibacter sp.]
MQDPIQKKKYFFSGYYSIDDIIRALREILMDTKVLGEHVKSFKLNLQD